MGFYRPQTKLREGNVFTGVCDSVHGGVPGPGGAWSRGGVCSQGGAWSRGVSAPGGVCSRGDPGGDPPGRLLLRAVRILLECILVFLIKTLGTHHHLCCSRTYIFRNDEQISFHENQRQNVREQRAPVYNKKAFQWDAYGLLSQFRRWGRPSPLGCRPP